MVFKMQLINFDRGMKRKKNEEAWNVYYSGISANDIFFNQFITLVSRYITLFNGFIF